MIDPILVIENDEGQTLYEYKIMGEYAKDLLNHLDPSAPVPMLNIPAEGWFIETDISEKAVQGVRSEFNQYAEFCSLTITLMDSITIESDWKPPFYFVGKYGEVGHDEKAAGVGQGRAYPVFSTYDQSNPEEKHTNAWFVLESEAIEWAKFKNRQ